MFVGCIGMRCLMSVEVQLFQDIYFITVFSFYKTQIKYVFHPEKFRKNVSKSVKKSFRRLCIVFYKMIKLFIIPFFVREYTFCFLYQLIFWNKKTACKIRCVKVINKAIEVGELYPGISIWARLQI